MNKDWNKLSMREKAAFIRIGVANGYKNIDGIKLAYQTVFLEETPINKYGSGGKKKKRTENINSPLARLAMQFFMSKGLTDYQAAGLVGNLFRESRLNPTAVNSGSGAYGIALWLGSRKKNLFAKYGKNPSLAQLLDYVWHELNNTHKTGLNKLLSSRNAEEAARNAMGYYEFSAGPDAAIREMRRWGQNGEKSMLEGINFASLLSSQPVIPYDVDRPRWNNIHLTFNEPMEIIGMPTAANSPLIEKNFITTSLPSEEELSQLELPIAQGTPQKRISDISLILQAQPIETKVVQPVKSFTPSERYRQLMSDNNTLLSLNLENSILRNNLYGQSDNQRQEILNLHLGAFGGNMYNDGGGIPLTSASIISIPSTLRTLGRKIKNRIYRTVDPLNYNIGKAAGQFIKGDTRNMNIDPARNEEWAKYLGVPYNQPSNFEPATHKPLMGNTYPTVLKFKDESLILSDEVLRNLILNKLNTGKNTMVIPGNGTGLGSYTVSMGEDDKGKYISYYDDWDINPFKGISADTNIPIISNVENIVPASNPFTVYGRRYYTDEDLQKATNKKSYGGPIADMFQNGGPEINWPALGTIEFNVYPDNTFVADSERNRGFISTITPNLVSSLWGMNPNDYEANRNIYPTARGKYINDKGHLVNPSFGKNSIIYNPDYANRDALSLDALHIMHDNPVYEDLYKDYIKAAHNNGAVYSSANDEFGEEGKRVLDKYYKGEPLTKEEQEIINPIFDGFLRRQFAPSYMLGMEGGYEAPVDLSNTLLGNKVSAIRDYLESYQLPEVTVTSNKHL